MTEAEWLTADYLKKINFVGQRGKRVIRERKLRLCGCAYLRCGRNDPPDDELRRAVEVAEEYADGVCGAASLAWQRSVVAGMLHWLKSHVVEQCYQLLDESALRGLKGCLIGFIGPEIQVILHDIFGNPFRPVAFAPEWRTDTAVALARAMYDQRDFGAMPILADALQDAGCDHPDILAHCRDTALTHVRGCWVTDLVLGKE